MFFVSTLFFYYILLYYKYLFKLTEFGFKVADVLAVFKVEKNRITAVSRLRSYNYELDKGPVGPVSGIESV